MLIEDNLPSRIIIPVRGIRTAMNRLRKHLEDPIVDHIVQALLINTLTVVKNWNWKPIVLTADENLIHHLKSLEIQTVKDDGTSLNQAITNAVMKVDEARFALIMPDLPGIESRHLQKITHLSRLYSHIICPTQDNGTAFAILPKEAFQASLFGKNSSKKLYKFCNEQRVRVAVLEIHKMLRDLDTLDDYEYWKPFLNNLDA
ncbi:MAG: hypothetical protein ACW98K_04665 [Candidatus Kariarchaeaceae archaeon]|jgi:2-phospho-L-lactate guanylyltransferase